MKTSLMKKLALAVALSASLTSVAQAVTLKMSHVRPQDTAIDLDAKRFAEDVKSATDGKVKIKIYAASALGDYTVVQERVSLGAIDMAVQPPASSADKRFQIVYMPYLVKTWDDAQKVFAKGSPMRGTVSELYGEQNIEVLAAWPVYFGGVSLNKEIAEAADPSVMKNAKLRVPPIKTFQLTADNIGFIGSPLPFSEAFTAVQTGVVDGVMGSGAEGYYASFRDVTKSYLPINTHFEMWYLIINKEVLGELSDAQQQKLQAAADRFEQARWGSARKDQLKNEQLLAKAGAHIVPVSEAQIEAHAKIVREKVWPEIIDDIGHDWAQNVLDKALN
ncbi:TRAP-type C4-dicarboxylate transport system, substrate-binding protein [Oceanospirillum multiglobuliferum]|uniref:C4-dicarboxylate ABC transporter n=1 Tax=Oceanospirillum multiglobuliferum TaxID=64969 RepID=A0A1T4PIE7_9GAMM|nr:TRAP transporter substrate-binding protein DctP [Oceanospirillum multiglobuliferum]OPX55530.1 C4-dicarboxylate ABC transporter [Oceanospirillum multiglobuliferum]SJZ91355.1 TRAP-type C4-dicarboxylate transport system, substrate-binding protein [Oceanospirillum multiglobuliferum]